MNDIKNVEHNIGKCECPEAIAERKRIITLLVFAALLIAMLIANEMLAK